MKKLTSYFTKFEIGLWLVSTAVIILSEFVFRTGDFMTLCASVIGVTSLIFNAKGNPFGQVLMVVFGVLYGIISFSVAYYGEMITYLGMTVPMAVFALVSWLRNPYKGNRAQVTVNTVGKKETVFMLILTAAVTVVFYFILKALGTANLAPGTLSVTTSFAAAYLTFRRSEYYALAYALNDIVLIVMWLLAAKTDITYVSVIICFVVFLVNDLYGFVSWQKMKKQQSIQD